MRLRVIARDVVAIWKCILALIIKALDDWADDQFEQELQRKKARIDERKKARIDELKAAIHESIEQANVEAKIPLAFIRSETAWEDFVLGDGHWNPWLSEIAKPEDSK